MRGLWLGECNEIFIVTNEKKREEETEQKNKNSIENWALVVWFECVHVEQTAPPFIYMRLFQVIVCTRENEVKKNIAHMAAAA